MRKQSGPSSEKTNQRASKSPAAKRRQQIVLTILALAVSIPCGLYCFGETRTTGDAMANNRQPEKAPAMQSETEQEARFVKTVKVKRNATEISNTYPGSVRASRTVKLAFRVGGPLIEVRAKPGDKVRKGDVLMRIDPRDFQSQVVATRSTLESAEAKLLAMKKGARSEDILALKATIIAAEAKRNFAKSQFDRFHRLIAANAVSRSQYEDAETQVEAAVAQLDALHQELAKAEAGAREEDVLATEAQIRGLQTQLKIAQDKLKDTILCAPFDGVITKQLSENFEQVSPGKHVYAIHDISTLELDVHLPMKELVYREVGQRYTAEVCFRSATGRVFQAQYHEMDTEADPFTRTYLVTFQMPAPEDINILPGMTADITINSCCSPTEDCEKLLIPADALLNGQNGKQYVWVISADSTVQRREITTGTLTESDHYVVRSGLQENEPIVAVGVAFLHEGMLVRTL